MEVHDKFCLVYIVLPLPLPEMPTSRHVPWYIARNQLFTDLVLK
jgi:hypothetical protein